MSAAIVWSVGTALAQPAYEAPWPGQSQLDRQLEDWRERRHYRPQPRRPVVVVVRRERAHDHDHDRGPRVAAWVRHREQAELLRCRSIVTAVGDQALTDEGAKTEANKAWAASARWSYGEKVISIQFAENITYQCGRSSIGSVAGQTFHRCEVKARPCEPPVISGEK